MPNLARRIPGLRSLLKMRDDVSALVPVCAHLENLGRTLATLGEVQWNHRRLALESYALTLTMSSKYDDPKRLNRHEAQVFSQNGEDGVIAEIFSRIGCTDRVFVEIGCGNGIENNTAYPLLLGWSGYWFDGDEANVAAARSAQIKAVTDCRLRVEREFFTRSEAEQVLQRYRIPEQFDLLSLDVDRNTPWIWQALKAFRPRVAVIEYNASIPPQDDWIVEYDAMAQWDGTLVFGASLRALERIGRAMGYVLVGCELAGVNAFFVREDVAADHFSAPYTAQHHYEPPRYFLIREWGHPRR